MEKAKADAVAAFRTSYPYFDECGGYYSNGLDDCLKQVAVVHPDLDLSQVVIDDTVPPTPGGADTTSDETNDSVHIVKDEVKDPTAKVVVKSAPKGRATPKGPSAANYPSTAGQSLFDAPPS